MSDTRWRHIVNGYQPVGRGEAIQVVAPAATLARMARVVGVTAEELRGVGRDDAAEEMTETDGTLVRPTDDDALPAFRYQRPAGLTDQQWDDLRRQHADYWDWLVERAARER